MINFRIYTFGIGKIKFLIYVSKSFIVGSQESVEWNGEMEHWNGILEWVN